MEAGDEEDGCEERRGGCEGRRDDLGPAAASRRERPSDRRSPPRGEIRRGNSREHRRDDEGRDGAGDRGGSILPRDERGGDPRRHRVGGRHDDDRRRPDPIGHRTSSLAVEADADNYTIASSCGDSRDDGTCPFKDVADGDNADAGNFHVGGGSPLGIDGHLSDKRGSSTMTSSSHRPTISCLRNGNFNNTEGGDKGGGGRSTYADDLRSFAESVTGASRDRVSYKVNIARHHPPAGPRNYCGRQYDEMEPSGGGGDPGGGLPEVGVPIHRNHNRVAPASPHNECHDGGSRARPRAKDFCKRFAGCDVLHSSASEKTDKRRYLWLFLAVCVACIIALALTVHHLGKPAVKEQGHADGGWNALETTVAPSMSSIPSVQPTSAPIMDPTKEPTMRPSAERERLIGEYVSSLSRGDSNEVGSPQYRAKMWLLYEDELILHLPTSTPGNQQGDSEVAQRIKQRFALATLYFSLGIGDGDLVKGWLVGEECRYVGEYGRAWDGVGCDEDGLVRAVALGELSHDLLKKAIKGLILSCCPAEFAVNSLPGACTHRWSQSQRDDTVGNLPPNLHRELNHQEQPRSHRHDSTYYRKSHDSDAPVGIEWKRLDWSDS